MLKRNSISDTWFPGYFTKENNVHSRNSGLFLSSPGTEPHISEPRKTGPPLQMVLNRNLASFGVKAIDIQKVSRLFTSSRCGTLVKEQSDTFAKTCTFHRHTLQQDMS